MDKKSYKLRILPLFEVLGDTMEVRRVFCSRRD